MISRIITITTFAMLLLLAGLPAACTAPAPPTEGTTAEADSETAARPASSSLPPSEAGAMAALEASPRHGEWVDVELPGSDQPINTWVGVPRAGRQRSSRARDS